MRWRRLLALLARIVACWREPERRPFFWPAGERGLRSAGVGPRSVAPGHQSIDGPLWRKVAVAAQDLCLCNGGPEMPVLRVHRADMFPQAVDRGEVMSRCANCWPAIITPRIVNMDRISPIFSKTALFCARRGHVAGLRRLTKDDTALWVVLRPFLPYPPLRGAPGAVAGTRGRVQTLTMAHSVTA